jgi:glutathione S-transferase
MTGLNASSALWQDDGPARDFFEMALKLVIGNKNYSSWSMRPWLALRANNIPFDEVLIPLYTGAADKQRILSFTHSGKVPALIDGDVTIWDSLAIIEYAAERFRERYGKSGPFLFGAFGGADAMFAPVVHRFRIYAIEVAPDVRDYMDTMMALPAFQEWTRAGLAETLVIEKFETV